MHYIYIYMYALLLMHAFLSEKLLPDGKISGKSDIIHRQTGENIYIYTILYYIILYCCISWRDRSAGLDTWKEDEINLSNRCLDYTDFECMRSRRGQ